MSESRNRAWDEAIEALRRAANELRGALSGSETASPEAKAAGDRLKSDVSQLDRAASDLLGALRGAIDARRAGIEESIDREQAERSAGQLRSSLESLAAMGTSLAGDVASAAKGSVEQAQPELKTAVRALDDVVGSAAAWLRATVDPDRGPRGTPNAEGQPPLDDL
jgi:hypothetical protein